METDARGFRFPAVYYGYPLGDGYRYPLDFTGFLTENSKSWVKRVVFPALDILAGLPSVVYGVWGILVVVPWISDRLAPHFVEYSTGYSTLAAGIVLGIMILPLLISLFVELFSSVPKEYREASLSLGATRWQTTKYVLLKKTFPGIVASVTLAISRAMGKYCTTSRLVIRRLLSVAGIDRQ